MVVSEGRSGTRQAKSPDDLLKSLLHMCVPLISSPPVIHHNDRRSYHPQKHPKMSSLLARGK